MKTLGLIGGTTWQSTIDYYRILNETVNARLGGVHSAKLLLYSVDFEEFHAPADPSDWARIGDAFSDIARLVAQGANGVILGCTEIPLLIKQADCAVPAFDTTMLHATAAVDFALQT